MRKILISLVLLATTLSAAVVATRAIFTDTETATGNTFDTGTIDIGVDGKNQWNKAYSLFDMKPSQTDYINFEVNNIGSNAVNVFKKLTNLQTNQGLQTEAEEEEENGTPKSDVDTILLYDLKVEVLNPGGERIWWQTLYDENAYVSEIKDKDLFLGMLPPDWRMKVTQSYHVHPETTNWAQGDVMTFDIVLTGEQLKGELVMENKEGEPDWLVNYNDGMKGLLTYKVKDSDFQYTLTGEGLLPNTNYSLIHYVDPWPGNGSGSVGLIDLGITDGAGKLLIKGARDLDANLINAKLWLVLSGDYEAGSKGLTNWQVEKYLFETGLVDYYDADL